MTVNIVGLGGPRNQCESITRCENIIKCESTTKYAITQSLTFWFLICRPKNMDHKNRTGLDTRPLPLLTKMRTNFDLI